MVLFHDHFHALLDLGQHGVEITREFGFADSDHPHVYDDTRCAGTLSSGREFLIENEHSDCRIRLTNHAHMVLTPEGDLRLLPVV
jgi:hypothetical protein